MPGKRALSGIHQVTLFALLGALAPPFAAARPGILPTITGGIDRAVGEAHATGGDGRLLYREVHWRFQTPQGPGRLVMYRCPDGRAFARKWLQADSAAQAPLFSLEDGRTGYREGVRRGNDGLEVYVARDGRERHTLLDTREAPVIDAGFDAYVRQHWDALGGGERETLAFLVPSRLDTLRFSVKRIEDTVIAGRPARQFRLGLASWIGFALPHIDVAYDAATRQLLRFVGLTNIRGDDGDNLRAQITFDPATDRPADVQGLAAAAAAPLDGRCPMP